ncbi:MAG: zinc-ribbon domain-containing protein [Myxococcota bacterium]|nr:zinc-ribbon domain-containing protein [Myxococcota bacterium]
MIVTCQNCETRFQLDDSRVPEDGVRVRCSACEHVFQVDAPSASAPSAPEQERVEIPSAGEDDFSDLGAEFLGGADEVEADPPPAQGHGPSSSQRRPVAGSATDSDAKVAIGAIALESVPAGAHRARSAPTSESVRVRAWLGTLGRTLGWAATLGMIALIAFSFVRETADSVGAAQPTFALGGLRAEGLHAEWVDTMSGRTLLAVTGELRNPSAQSESLGARIRVSLEDSEGRRLASPAALMGLRIRESEVRELPPKALEAAQERASQALGVLEIGAGEAIAIQAIFSRPSAEAARFALSLDSSAEVLETE